MTVPRFWRKIRSRYNLIGTHCKRCNSFYFPPRNICPKCRRRGEIEEYRFSGRGEVVTFTVIHSAPKDFKYGAPYVLAIIKLDEGPRLTAQVDCRPEEIHIGMRVRAVFRKILEEGESGIIHYGTKFIPEERFN
ncbi:MAG: Zn-ribbon domain-containing OB-fold protein [Archaeoglobi archaeon]|nr:Zn-ribbon domain-containing OB-fold protein [Candidatus Mnemosynella bozhongmuii]